MGRRARRRRRVRAASRTRCQVEGPAGLASRLGPPLVRLRATSPAARRLQRRRLAPRRRVRAASRTARQTEGSRSLPLGPRPHARGFAWEVWLRAASNVDGSRRDAEFAWRRPRAARRKARASSPAAWAPPSPDRLRATSPASRRQKRRRVAPRRRVRAASSPRRRAEGPRGLAALLGCALAGSASRGKYGSALPRNVDALGRDDEFARRRPRASGILSDRARESAAVARYA